MYNLLINAPQLQTLLAQGTPCAIFDCSFDLMKPELALSVVVSPMQMDVGAFAAMIGSPTVTVLLTVSLQPLVSVAVRV